MGSGDEAESAGATCCPGEVAGPGWQRDMEPAKAGSTWQSHRDANLSRRHRVNSRRAEPPPSPSQTPRTYQSFSGNRRKPRRTRESIPHEKPGSREQMGFITAPLSATDWTDFSSTTGHGYSISRLLQTWQIRGLSGPLLPNASADKRGWTLSAASSKGSGGTPGFTALTPGIPSQAKPPHDASKQNQNRKASTIAEGVLDFPALPALAGLARATAAQPSLSGRLRTCVSQLPT